MEKVNQTLQAVTLPLRTEITEIIQKNIENLFFPQGGIFIAPLANAKYQIPTHLVILSVI